MFYKLRDWIDINKLDWYYLSKNENAIELLKENLDKIDWDYLSSNPSAIDLLEQHQDIGFTCYIMLLSNPSIFTYDYEKIKDNNKELNEEIIAYSLHPDRLEKLIKIYGKKEVFKSYQF